MSDDEPVHVDVGDHVIYRDPSGVDRDALVTLAHEADRPTINLVIVSPDEDRTDSYGRQTEKPTSVSHEDNTTVDGRYWRLPE